MPTKRQITVRVSYLENALNSADNAKHFLSLAQFYLNQYQSEIQQFNSYNLKEFKLIGRYFEITDDIKKIEIELAQLKQTLIGADE
jgi:hypothetical protein